MLKPPVEKGKNQKANGVPSNSFRPRYGYSGARKYAEHCSGRYNKFLHQIFSVII
jgi:hypothetical protein